ncbi:MAG: mechanosensitive ion channel family protein [bacterium]|nr:mechanosensitive ion channel family protein [bacterium]
MAAADLYKKAFYFLIVAGSVLLALFILSLLEDAGRNYLVSDFGFDFDSRGRLAPRAGPDAPNMMTVTGISLIENVIRIFKVILWMVFVVSLIRLLTNILFETVLRSAAQTEIATLLRTVLSIVIYIVAFFIIFQSQYPQIELAPLFTGSAILGIVVGLALQDTLGNLFAGLALQVDHPFEVGDVIVMANRGQGVVESVSWRGVRIRTFQNKLLVISNAALGKETIEVAPQYNLNARLVMFNTTYSASPAKTAQVVREAIRQVDNVSTKMRPVIRIRDFGESSLDWEIKYWPENYAKFNDTDAMIRQRIWYAFQREGISFAFPTRTHYTAAGPETPSIEEQVSTTAEYLERVPIFAPLSDEETAQLARSSIRRVYAPGELIVRKGQEGTSMFVIIRGSVKVQLPDAAGPRTINQLGPNDFFGEMSLLTGEPRSANVVAEEETDVMQIRKAAVKPIFEANPELLETISAMIEERRKLLTQEQFEQTMRPTRPESGMMSAIRKFFGIGEY